MEQKTKARLAFSLASLILAISPAQAAEMAAVVVDFGGTTPINGERSGVSIGVFLGTVLQEGDKLVIPADGFLKLDRNDECDLVVASETIEATGPGCTRQVGKEYVVPASRFADGVASRYQRLAEVLAWWDPKRTRKPMRSRDSYEPRIPALDGVEEPLVAAGERDLQVHWVDGRAPFRLFVEAQDGRSIEGAVSEVDRRGSVHLEISNGQTYKLILTAGSQSQTYLLHGTDQLAIAPGKADTDSLDRASEILDTISRSRGKWAFEGAQQLFALRLEPRVHQALLDAIEFGDWP